MTKTELFFKETGNLVFFKSKKSMVFGIGNAILTILLPILIGLEFKKLTSAIAESDPSFFQSASGAGSGLTLQFSLELFALFPVLVFAILDAFLLGYLLDTWRKGIGRRIMLGEKFGWTFSSTLLALLANSLPFALMGFLVGDALCSLFFGLPPHWVLPLGYFCISVFFSAMEALWISIQLHKRTPRTMLEDTL